MADGVLKFVEDYEARVREDPNRVEKPVVCVRQNDINGANQRLAFGPTWRTMVDWSRTCVMCDARLIVRPIFLSNPLLICLPCAPAFLQLAHERGWPGTKQP